MTEIFTAQQFAEWRPDLPDGGRWVELIEGRVVSFQPPDPQQGTTVLNLSKAIAEHLQTGAPGEAGYACFELGLLVAESPDTVRFPAMSYFGSGRRFAHTDEVLTAERPDLVVEVPADPERRRDMSRRVREYLALGTKLVWVVDFLEQQVHVFPQQGASGRFEGKQRLSGGDVLSGFDLAAADLFGEPSWWRS